jgi:CheY-like chemotaxis protein
MMSGKIWVESETNGGSVFHFTARFGLQKQARGAHFAAGSASGRRGLREGRSELRILLVEDNAMNQVLAQRLIQKWGHKLVVAGNGREALAALGKGKFDLILMDVQMPEMSGIEVAAAIREKEKGTGERVPIIATTASAMEEDRERCLAAGMDAYISKPIERDVLLETIHGLTGFTQEAKSSEGARAQNPIFDATAALDSLEGDNELLHEIAGLFLAQAPRHMEKIRAAVADRDPKRLERAAHGLKGAAANLLAQGVVNAAGKLEEIGRAGYVAGSQQGLVLLEEELQKLQSALGEFEKEYARS